MSTTSTAPQDPWFKKVSVIFAFMIFIGYFIFIYFLIDKTGGTVNETQWSRYIYLFSGVEAILFSAVGFIFGKEVNRTRADKAEKKEEEANKEKEAAKDKANAEAAKGKKLAEKVLDKIETPPDTPNVMNIRKISQGNEELELVNLAKYAQKLYPDAN